MRLSGDPGEVPGLSCSASSYSQHCPCQMLKTVNEEKTQPPTPDLGLLSMARHYPLYQTTPMTGRKWFNDIKG